MTNQTVVQDAQDLPDERLKIAIEKVIKNPRYSKTVKSAVGLGLIQHRNYIVKKRKIWDHKDKMTKSNTPS